MRACKFFVVCASFCAALAAGSAAAQFVGGPSGVMTVKNLLDNGRDDQLVVLEGYIVDQIKHEDYTFRDATGQIEVEIDDEVFAGQRIDPKTKVRIEGEYEKEVVGPNTIDVHRLTIIR